MAEVDSGFGILLHDVCNVMMALSRFLEKRGGALSKDMNVAIMRLNTYVCYQSLIV